MSVRYWVLGSDELMTQPGLRLPAGLRLADPASVQVMPDPRLPGIARWYLFEDDNAPAELEGKRIELILRVEDGVPVIAERRLL